MDDWMKLGQSNYQSHVILMIRFQNIPLIKVLIHFSRVNFTLYITTNTLECS